MAQEKNKPTRSVSEKIWKFFASLRLTILLFALLTISVLVGSFIIQKQFAQDGQIQSVYSPETIRIFEFFGLFDLYHSSWFVFLLFLFGVNNICASIEMWPRHRKLYKHDDPELPLSAFPHQNFHDNFALSALTADAIAKISETLKKLFGPVVRRSLPDGERFYVNRHPWSHFGVYVVHLGVILVLIGGVVGSIGSFEGQMQLSEGETSSTVHIRNRYAGKAKMDLDFQVRCHDIRIETYESGAPKDYFSDLEILDKNGNSRKRGVIQVNSPLSYDGISFYQATYGSKKINEKSYYDLQYFDKKTQKTVAVPFPADAETAVVPGSGQTLRLITYKDNLSIPLEGGNQDSGEFLALELLNKSGAVDEKVLLFKDIPQADAVYRPDAPGMFVFGGLREDYELQEVTGLQVARDPGAPVVFFGSAILLLGVVMTFFTSHQKIWLHWQGGTLHLAGKCSRNPWAFGKKFKMLTDTLRSGLGG